MSVRSRRLAVAAVIAASAIAVPAVALASVSGTSSGKPAPPVAASGSAAPGGPAASKSAAAGGSAAPGGSAAAAKSAARQSGALDNAAASAMVAALATQLGVSHSAAQHALNQLDALNGPGGIDPANPAFAAVARDLGVSPAQLAAALPAAKQAAGQSVAGG
jgi:hypothetical protein